MRCLRCRCRPQSIPPLSRSARRCRSRTHCEPSGLRSRFWADAHEVLVALVAIGLLLAIAPRGDPCDEFLARQLADVVLDGLDHLPHLLLVRRCEPDLRPLPMTVFFKQKTAYEVIW